MHNLICKWRRDRGPKCNKRKIKYKKGMRPKLSHFFLSKKGDENVMKKRGEEKNKRKKKKKKMKGMELVMFYMGSLVWFWVWIAMVFYGFLGS